MIDVRLLTPFQRASLIDDIDSWMLKLRHPHPWEPGEDGLCEFIGSYMQLNSMMQQCPFSPGYLWQAFHRFRSYLVQL